MSWKHKSQANAAIRDVLPPDDPLYGAFKVLVKGALQDHAQATGSITSAGYEPKRAGPIREPGATNAERTSDHEAKDVPKLGHDNYLLFNEALETFADAAQAMNELKKPYDQVLGLRDAQIQNIMERVQSEMQTKHDQALQAATTKVKDAVEKKLAMEAMEKQERRHQEHDVRGERSTNQSPEQGGRHYATSWKARKVGAFVPRDLTPRPKATSTGSATAVGTDGPTTVRVENVAAADEPEGGGFAASDSDESYDEVLLPFKQRLGYTTPTTHGGRARHSAKKEVELPGKAKAVIADIESQLHQAKEEILETLYEDLTSKALAHTTATKKFLLKVVRNKLDDTLKLELASLPEEERMTDVADLYAHIRHLHVGTQSDAIGRNEALDKLTDSKKGIQFNSYKNVREYIMACQAALSTYQQRGGTMDRQQLIERILHRLPRSYYYEVRDLTKDGGFKGTLMQLADKLSEFEKNMLQMSDSAPSYRGKVGDANVATDGINVNLDNINKGAGRGDGCFNCGKPGHIKRNCPEKKARQPGAAAVTGDKEPQERCRECGKTNHKEKDCFRKPENKGQFEKWVQTMKESGKWKSGDPKKSDGGSNEKQDKGGAANHAHEQKGNDASSSDGFSLYAQGQEPQRDGACHIQAELHVKHDGLHANDEVRKASEPSRHAPDRQLMGANTYKVLQRVQRVGGDDGADDGEEESDADDDSSANTAQENELDKQREHERLREEKRQSVSRRNRHRAADRKREFHRERARAHQQDTDLEERGENTLRDALLTLPMFFILLWTSIKKGVSWCVEKAATQRRHHERNHDLPAYGPQTFTEHNRERHRNRRQRPATQQQAARKTKEQELRGMLHHIMRAKLERDAARRSKRTTRAAHTLAFITMMVLGWRVGYLNPHANVAKAPGPAYADGPEPVAEQWMREMLDNETADSLPHFTDYDHGDTLHQRERNGGDSANTAQTEESKEKESRDRPAAAAADAGADQSDDGEEVLLDSGANCHVFKKSVLLRAYRAVKNAFIGTAGKARVKVVGHGDAKVHGVELHDVRHAPDGTRNLASVGCICDAANGTHEVRFTATGFVITNTPCECDAHVISVGTRNKDGFYVFANEKDAALLGENKDQNAGAREMDYGNADVSVRVESDGRSGRVNVAVKPVAKGNGTVMATKSVRRLHNQLQHAHLGRMKEMVKTGMLKVPQELARFLHLTTDLGCEHCTFGKAHRDPVPERAEKRATRVLERVMVDIKGPMNVESRHGKRYYLNIVDDFSGFSIVAFLRTKDEAAKELQNYVTWAEKQTGEKVKLVQGDNDKSIFSGETLDFLKERGIEVTHSPPYIKELNGAPEREHRTLTETELTLLHQSGLPATYWDEAVMCASWAKSRLTTEGLRGATNPISVFYNARRAHQPLMPFGCRVLAHVPGENRHEGEYKSEECVMLGYATKGGYRLLRTSNLSIIDRRDVEFYPDVFPFNTTSKEGKEAQDYSVFGAAPAEGGAKTPDQSNTTNAQSAQPKAPPRRSTRVSSKPATFSDEHSDLQYKAQKVHEAWRKEMEEGKHNEDAENFANYTHALHRDEAYLATDEPVEVYREPLTIQEALSGPDAIHWREAILRELQSHKKNGTWVQRKLPRGTKTIGCKWVFKVKRNEDGEIARYKARLVAQGFSQVKGVHYQETFAPTVRWPTLRLFLGVSAAKGWARGMKQLDVETAYLIPELGEREEIFMRTPPGVVAEVGEAMLLKKSLYGLKQAGRKWNKNLHATLIRAGYKQSESDPCLYLHHAPGTGDLDAMIICYVDDILVAGENKVVQDVVNHFTNTYKMTVEDKVTHFLGARVEIRKDGSIFVGQDAYLENILRRFDLLEADGTRSPGEHHLTKKQSPVTDEEKEAMAKVPYRQAVGALQYLAVLTRPDIAQAVNQASRFLQNPGKAHWKAVKNIMRYLKATKNKGLLFKGGVELKGAVEAYSDANWAEDKDTRRSTSGYLFTLAGTPISWRSRLQPVVALSSCESELMALTEAAKEALWMRRVLQELGLMQEDDAITIKEDNQGAKAVAEDHKFSDRTKHIATRHFFVREQVGWGTVRVEWVSTKQQAADIFTKPLAPTPFIEAARRLNLSERAA